MVTNSYKLDTICAKFFSNCSSVRISDIVDTRSWPFKNGIELSHAIMLKSCIKDGYGIVPNISFPSIGQLYTRRICMTADIPYTDEELVDTLYYGSTNNKSFKTAESFLYNIAYRYWGNAVFPFPVNDEIYIGGPGILFKGNGTPLYISAAEGIFSCSPCLEFMVHKKYLYINPNIFCDQGDTFNKYIIKRIIPEMVQNGVTIKTEISDVCVPLGCSVNTDTIDKEINSVLRCSNIFDYSINDL